MWRQFFYPVFWLVIGTSILLVPRALLAQIIVAAEYFINNDPGEGNGIPITTGLNVEEPTLEFDLTNLKEGDILYVRFKAANDKWSAPFAVRHRLPFKGRGSVIARAEYFINEDPGEGKGTSVTLDPSGAFLIDLSNANPGDLVYFRIMDNHLRWSAPAFIEIDTILARRDAYIVQAEYFINMDPGIGQGTPLEIDPNSGAFTIPKLSLRRGDVLYVRFKDSYNRWGPARAQEYFFRRLTKAEYRLVFSDSRRSPVLEMELSENDDPTKAFFTALTDTLTPFQEIDSIYVRFHSEDFFIGPWFGFNYKEIPTPAEEEPASYTYALQPPYPNPFSNVVHVTFSLPTYERVQVAIYDLLGRQVAMLADQEFPPGEYTLQWDGRSDNGTRVPAGLYFCRMTTPSFTQTLALIRVR